MLQLAHLGVVVAGEVHHAAALLKQLRQYSTHHPVQAHGALAAADHHQQRTLSLWHPVRQRLGLKKISAHRHARHQRSTAGNATGGHGQANGHGTTEAPQQAGHPAGDGICLMQHRRYAAEAGREDGRCCDVATRGEHHLDPFPSDQLSDVEPSGQQSQQLHQLVQSAALETSCLDGHQLELLRHQLRFQAVRDAQPTHLPTLGKRFRHGQGGEQVATGAAGGDQKPGHGGGRPRSWRLT